MEEKDELTKATEILEKDRQKRIQACSEEMNALLEKYGLRIEVTQPQIMLKEKG